MATEKSNLLVHYTTVNRVGLMFIFIASILLGAALITTGTVSITRVLQHNAQLKFARENSVRLPDLSSVFSNESANPGPIYFFFDSSYAGALTEDGEFHMTTSPKNNGMLFVVFGKPLPDNPGQVRFPAQTLTLESSSGTMSVCTPAMSSNRGLWVDQKGNTYLDKALSIRARSCT